MDITDMTPLSALAVLLSQPGEHPVYCEGGAGYIEGRVSIPEAPRENICAVIGHPHSLHGGSMQNKVVTTVARAMQARNIISVRFNFRGVGASAGYFDHGIAESCDMQIVAEHALQVLSGARLILSGFSFGSFVAYRAALRLSPALLLTIAPPVHHFDFEHEEGAHLLWHLIAATQDEIVPSSEITPFLKRHPYIVPHWQEAGHFFHGGLVPLKSTMDGILHTSVLACG